MTTIRQLIQTNPIKATELFAKLVDTSESAIKTREKLFADLREELELLSELEEKHLFPVLRKHEQTKDLVADAIDDNKRMRKILAELDKTPRSSEEFGSKVAELRTVFQQHVRDEKKDLLPAVLKALSDEEAQAIVESIGDRKAEIEEEKRSEADERRSAARQVREQAENAQQAAETVVATLWTGPKAAERTAQRAQDAARVGLGTMAEAAQRTSDQVTQAFNRAGERAHDLAQQSSQNLAVMTEAGNILARGFADISQEWFSLMQAQLRRNVDGFSALARCRSIADLIECQNGLMRDRLQETIDGVRRVTAVSTRVADETTQTVSTQLRKNTPRRAA
jgi:hypothetical protein